MLGSHDYDAILLSHRLQPVPHALAEQIVLQVAPRFVKQHQRRRAVQTLFDLPEQVQQDRKDCFFVKLKKMLRLKGQEPAVAECVGFRVQELAQRPSQRVVLERGLNNFVLNVGPQLG